MFHIKRVRSRAEMRDQREVDSIVQRLQSDGFAPVLRSMREGAAQAATVDTNSLGIGDVFPPEPDWGAREMASRLVGDLFFTEQYTYGLQPVGTQLQVWEVRRHSATSKLSEFCASVENAVKANLDGRRVRGMRFNWEPVAIAHSTTRRYGNPFRGQRLVAWGVSRSDETQELEGQAPDYDEDASLASRSLISQETREFALRLAQLGKVRSVDAASEASESTTAPLIARRVVRREYLVLCKQDSHTICTIHDRAELEDSPAGLLSCPTCGRAFKDELVQEVFALTDGGRQLLQGSRWMTIWVTDLLVSAGISRESIKCNLSNGEDELDIMTEALGPRIFFELKDREFGLGDAYAFAYRVSRYRGNLGVVLTTDRVAQEAKQFLGSQNPAPEANIKYELLEGEDGIEKGIAQLVDSWSRRGVLQVVYEVMGLLAINLTPVLNAWMDRLPTQALAPSTIDEMPAP